VFGSRSINARAVIGQAELNDNNSYGIFNSLLFDGKSTINLMFKAFSISEAMS
jgi:hypothetical protein